MPAMSDIISRHHAAVASVLSFDTDIVVERAEGLWVYDHAGNRWADFACGTAVTNLGHNHPDVTAAAIEQMGRVTHSGVRLPLRVDRRGRRAAGRHHPSRNRDVRLCQLGEPRRWRRRSSSLARHRVGKP